MLDPQTLLQNHGDAVWRTVFRLLGDHDDAHDCYQDTFLAALRIAQSEEVRSWPALLKRIATRRAMDRLRERYAKPAPAALGEAPLPDPDPAHPGRRLESHEQLHQARAAMAELPERQAEAFWLRHMEQMSPDQIAEHMNVSAANARQLVHRAAQALRDRLAPASPASTRFNPALTGGAQ
ncbi:MAG: sigma-70 family RNA polymerase sigma factor [Planctomycetota bacterium]